MTVTTICCPGVHLAALPLGQQSGHAGGRRRLDEDALASSQKPCAARICSSVTASNSPPDSRCAATAESVEAGIADPDRGRDRLRSLDRMTEHERRGPTRLEGPHPWRPGGQTGLPRTGCNHASRPRCSRRCRPAGHAGRERRRARRRSRTRPSSGPRSGPGSPSSPAPPDSAPPARGPARRQSSKLPSTWTTCAPCTMAWASLPAAILPAGSSTTGRSPARAA